MAAIAYPRFDEGTWDPGWYDPAVDPAPLHLVPDPIRTRRRRTTTARTYRRRRLVVAVLVIGLLLTLGALLGRLGGGPLTAPEPTPAHPAAQVMHVVQPGETVWAIARALQPTGDVRPLVDRIQAEQHGQALRVGEVIALP